jgi:hypothetical protein
MIEEARAILRTWGAAEPNFLLTNSKLTFQMTMIPEKTQYLTQGPDGMRKLRDGPDIASYRGLKIINSRSFSMEEGAPPRDVLRRRVRVAEYYRIPYEAGVEEKSFSFYDESKDAWQKFTWHELFRMAQIGEIDEPQDGSNGADWDDGDEMYTKRATKLPNYGVNNTVVDYNIKKELYQHMTVGEIEGTWNDGFRLAGGDGNLVLNPWYALCEVNIVDGGRAVPTLRVLRGGGGGGARDVDDLRLRKPHAAGHPSQGRDEVDMGKYSEFMFHRFPAILKAFGYDGNMDFTYKTDNAKNHMQAQAQPAEPNMGQEGGYTGELNQAICHGSFRGQPDYNAYTYQTARENFHRFLMMYLQVRLS